jgi:hypothetical protein
MMIFEHLRKHVDCGELFLRITTCYIIMSWLSDRVPCLPILRGLGDLGTGKSRWLRVAGDLLYRRILVSTASTFSPIFRLAERWNASLAIDEADLGRDDVPLEKYLLSRYQKGIPFLRSDKNNPERTETFDPFGATLLTTRERFRTRQGAALESRCLTEVFDETDRKDIPRNLPESYLKERNQILSCLLYFRLKNWNRDLGDLNRNLHLVKGLHPRLQEIVLPMLASFEGVRQITQDILAFVEQQQQTLYHERQNSDEGMVLAAYLDLVASGNNEPSPSEIAEKVSKELPKYRSVSAKWVGRKLEALKLERKRTEKKRYVVHDPHRIKKLKKRYGLDGVGAIEENAENA